MGEDTAILDKGERLNEEAMYAIYTGGDMKGLEEKEEEFMDLNEAEERHDRGNLPENFNRYLSPASPQRKVGSGWVDG